MAGRHDLSGAPESANLTARLAHSVVLKAAVSTAAFAGLAVGAGSAAWAGLQHQARLASERIGVSAGPPPLRDGLYLPDGRFRAGPTATPRQLGRAIRLVMLGDSTSAGYGAADADGLPGVMLARGLAVQLDRPVQLTTVAAVGSGAADLDRQTDLASRLHPDVAVIVVGANDVRDRYSPVRSASELAAAVTTMRNVGAAVVVGTCPDLGVVTPIPPPLRQLAGHWSRQLAERQEKAVRAAGASAVSISRLVSPGFVGHPELFSQDRFHPSGAGYARAVAVLLPAAILELGSRPGAAESSPLTMTPLTVTPLTVTPLTRTIDPISVEADAQSVG